MALILEDFIEVSNTAKSLDELVLAYEKALAKQGFDKFIFSLMTAHEELQESAQHGVLVNYPQDWVEYYTQNGFFNCISSD